MRLALPRTVGVVLAIGLLFAGVGTALSPAAHGAEPRSLDSARRAGTTTSPGDHRARLLFRHTRVELARNGTFHAGRTHWRVQGGEQRRLRIVHPGYKSRHAARLRVTPHGSVGLAERLKGRRVARGDRYLATAMVRSSRRRSRIIVEIDEMKGGRTIGHSRREFSLRHQRWRRVAVSFIALAAGTGLVVHLNAPPSFARSRLVADNIRAIRTITVTSSPGSANDHGGVADPGGSAPAPVTTPSPLSSPTPVATASPGSTAPAGGGPSPVTTTSSCAVSAALVPACGVWFGAYKHPDAGENWQSAVTDLESSVGHPFGLVYRYHDMSGGPGSGQFPDQSEQALGRNHLLMFSWQSRVFATNTQLAWSDIAAGKYDSSVIDPEAARLKAYGRTVFLTFDPEMDRIMSAAGSASEYVAAYRHIHDRFADDGVNNVVWVWTTTGYGGNDALFPRLYPGNSYVDWIGWDPYNFASCHHTGWRDFNEVIDPFYSWLESNGYGDKPFMLPEYGTVADPSDPAASGQWYAGIPAALASHPNIKALVDWDDSAGSCNSELTVDPGTLGGFSEAAGNSMFVRPLIGTSG